MTRVAARIYANSILKSGPRIGFRQAIKEARSALSTAVVRILSSAYAVTSSK
jgi:hypothetical protein